MKRIDTATRAVDLFGAGKDGFRNSNKGAGIAATQVDADWCNNLQEELANYIESKGIVLDPEDHTQLGQAIQRHIDGGDYKPSVRVASTAAINLAAPGANIDGVAMVAGDRFLEKDHGTPALRGIYIWNGAAVPATRAEDFDEDADVTANVKISVEEGTANADTTWMLTTNNPIIVGTTALTFTQQNTIADASETIKGKVELANSAECLAGTDESRAVTPAGIRAALSATGSAPIYAARAFVRFNGVGVVSILASGNVSSITDNAAGSWTVNFTTALPDANYAYALSAKAVNSFGSNDVLILQHTSVAPTSSACPLMCKGASGGSANDTEVSATFFR